MADPAPLRKCEEPLEKFPAEKIPTALWLFLKGVEGFDSQRASDCLAKLLDNHYDTVAVLKLATKRDLVEDTGILPGDALRIVDAAKDYVAVAAAPAEHGNASKPVQQDACRPRALRETTAVSAPPVVAAQSSLPAHPPAAIPQQQQKEVQVVSQVAASSQQACVVAATQEPPGKVSFVNARYAPADPTVPAPWKAFVDGRTGQIYYWNPETNISQFNRPSALEAASWLPVAPGPKVPQTGPQTAPIATTYPHTCRICNAKCASESQAHMHYNGRRHMKAVSETRQQSSDIVQPPLKASQGQDAWAAKQQPSPTKQQGLGAKRPSQSTPLHACGICNVKCGSEIVLRSHFNGKKHILGMEQAIDSNDNEPTPYLYCSLCDVTSACKRNLAMHFNGKKHAQIMKEYSDSGNSSYYSDSESDC